MIIQLLDTLFQINDQASTVYQVYSDIIKGATTMEKGKKILFPEDVSAKPTAQPPAVVPKKETTNLLDYDDTPAVQAPSSGSIKNPIASDPCVSTPSKPNNPNPPRVSASPVVTGSKQINSNVAIQSSPVVSTSKNINNNIVTPAEDPFGSSSADPFGNSTVDPFADFTPTATAVPAAPAAAPTKAAIDLDALFGSAQPPTPPMYYPQQGIVCTNDLSF